MYSSKLILSVFTALLIPGLGVYAQDIPAGCRGVASSEIPQNTCRSNEKFCGGVPNGGLAWICCPESFTCN
ncbi:hypothetical protein LZ32DRAFT_601205 [Colletotrichum eremochloae]|nr:hypothetical protein LZ32DRAFT_601205 [Colletotrichum eremochloae]